MTVLSASGACSAPTGSQRPVDVDKYLTALYNKRNDKEQQESYSANGCRCRTGKCAAVESAGGCVL